MLDEATRARLLAAPELVLHDRALMQALGLAYETDAGNLVDIRGPALAALEHQLGRLEVTHDRVISAAFDQQHGISLIHQGVLALLEAESLDTLIASLDSVVAPQMQIERLRLLLETETPRPALSGGLVEVAPGTITRLCDGRVRLGPVEGSSRAYHGATRVQIKSQAMIPLAINGRVAMLLFGAAEAERFLPDDGTDFLRFFAEAFRRVIGRWLT